MKKFLIGSIVSLGLLFGTMPRAQATPHVSLPVAVHAFPHYYITPCSDGWIQVWGVEQQADLLVYTLIAQYPC